MNKDILEQCLAWSKSLTNVPDFYFYYSLIVKNYLEHSGKRLQIVALSILLLLRVLWFGKICLFEK